MLTIQFSHTRFSPILIFTLAVALNLDSPLILEADGDILLDKSEEVDGGVEKGNMDLELPCVRDEVGKDRMLIVETGWVKTCHELADKCERGTRECCCTRRLMTCWA